MEKDIKAIAILLSTQAMINLGEIPDPVSGEAVVTIDKAVVFLELLEVLSEKTKGNLTEEEAGFINGLLENLKDVYSRRCND